MWNYISDHPVSVDHLLLPLLQQLQCLRSPGLLPGHDVKLSHLGHGLQVCCRDDMPHGGQGLVHGPRQGTDALVWVLDCPLPDKNDCLLFH